MLLGKTRLQLPGSARLGHTMPGPGTGVDRIHPDLSFPAAVLAGGARESWGSRGCYRKYGLG